MGSTFTPVDLIRYGTFSPEMLAYLWLAAENRKSIMVIGGTASGKTSTLNSLAFFIPPDAKIVSIEDTREISLYQKNWLPNVTRETGRGKKFDMHELVQAAMRQRPECIIVGEVRGREALALFQAMATGHGTFCTMHAGSVQEAANRLEGEPINLPRPMLAGLDVVCVQALVYQGKQRLRRNQHVVEFTGLDPASGEIRIAEIFTWDPATDSLRKTGESHLLREIMVERGWTPFKLTSELENRERVLRYMNEKNMTSPGEIASIVRRYHLDPAGILEKISSTSESG
jgi:flagellar protein FlaI